MNQLPSASSSLNLGVEPFQFLTSVADLELPVDTTLFGVGFFGPEADLGLEMCQLTNAAPTETLARHTTEFTFRDVQPTAVFRRVAECEATQVGARTTRLEGFVKGPFRVGVEVVAHQRYLLAVAIPRV